MPPGGMQETSSHATRPDARRPVLVVKVGGASADAAGERTHSCDVRLLRSMREQPDDQLFSSNGGEVTAVVILRDATPSSVVSCVRAATRGGGVISPDVLSQLLPAAAGGPDPGEPGLSEREHLVLRMLAEGESTRGIAERLSYSERTVKNIVRDLLSKLNCKTRAHAVALAVRRGVI